MLEFEKEKYIIILLLINYLSLEYKIIIKAFESFSFRKRNNNKKIKM